MRDPNIDDQANELIRKWGSMVQTKIQANARGMSDGKRSGFVTRNLIKDGKRIGTYREGKLANSIKTKFREVHDVITSVNFSFERHGVFVHKGVGRGYPISGGFVLSSANPRQPNDWFNKEIEESLPELADKLAEINADVALNATRIMIK